jgi:hypothetical protein
MRSSRKRQLRRYHGKLVKWSVGELVNWRPIADRGMARIHQLNHSVHGTSGDRPLSVAVRGAACRFKTRARLTRDPEPIDCRGERHDLDFHEPSNRCLGVISLRLHGARIPATRPYISVQHKRACRALDSRFDASVSRLSPVKAEGDLGSADATKYVAQQILLR